MELEIDILGKGKAQAELDERNPETARKIYEVLPIEGRATIWLEEVYFQIPVDLDYENPSESSKKGDISYWPPGNAFCIFYGDSQPASDVNHIGRVTENLELFRKVEDRDLVVIRVV